MMNLSIFNYKGRILKSYTPESYSRTERVLSDRIFLKDNGIKEDILEFLDGEGMSFEDVGLISMEYMTKDWEILVSDNENITERKKIVGGWELRTRVKHKEINTIFIPDSKHEWKIVDVT